MTDLPARLQEALGDAYHLERELGGGGMSRLFIATERSLNRQVVVKVLPPELTSEVSAARFKQEIEVAARLQHPHIVPILGAGASGDLLYYIMPYVAGESLRHRLIASGKLPVEDAVRILSEVARALGYAHRQGIVHRDIKPENILLEDGQAVLADFGVARAIVAARTSDVGEVPHITGTGMSVGTPTYMAPEQAAGEGNIDARADLYALGVVGYEMLTGQHPFAATSAQKMIAAHLTTPAPSVGKLRPETPAPVSAAIARALSKEPTERFPTADEFRAALTGTSAKGWSIRRSMALLSIAAVVAMLAIGALWLLHRHAPTLDANLVAIAPFDVVDPDLKLWHEGMVDILSRNLDGAGPLRTASPTIVLKEWSGRADKESARALGRLTGARLAIFGALIHSGRDSAIATASVVDVSSGRVLGEVQAGDALSRMGRLADSLTVAILRQLGKSRELGGAQISSVGTTSLPALKAFLEGEHFFRQSTWDSAIAYYETAIANDSQFAIALEHEGEALGWNDGEEKSRARMRTAADFNHGLSPRDSLIIHAGGILADLSNTTFLQDFRKIDKAQRALFSTLSEAVRRYPGDPQVWERLGDAQMHWGWGPGLAITPRQIAESFDHAIALDSAFTPAYIHATSLAFRRSTAEGRQYAEALLAQHATGPVADGMRLAYRLADTALLSSAARQRVIDSAPANQLGPALEALYNWNDRAETGIALQRAIERRVLLPAARNVPEDRITLAYLLASRGHASESLRIQSNTYIAAPLAVTGAIPSAVADSVFRSDLFCPACAMISSGIFHDTIAVRYALHASITGQTNIPAGAPSHDVFSNHVAQGYVLLARHDTAGALREFETLSDSGCHRGCGWVKLTRSQLLESRGRYSDAAKVLDDLQFPSGGVFETLLEFERGRVAEQMNDKVRAREAYEFVSDIWQNGDPAFQAYVAQARAGLRRVSAESGTTRIPTRKTLP